MCRGDEVEVDEDACFAARLSESDSSGDLNAQTLREIGTDVLGPVEAFEVESFGGSGCGELRFGCVADDAQVLKCAGHLAVGKLEGRDGAVGDAVDPGIEQSLKRSGRGCSDLAEGTSGLHGDEEVAFVVGEVVVEGSDEILTG